VPEVVGTAGQWGCLLDGGERDGRRCRHPGPRTRRDLAAARRFFTRALRAGTVPAEVTTDRAPVYPRVLDELIPSVLHTVERYANNPVETDHGG
jgi:IS6 family transposase